MKKSCTMTVMPLALTVASLIATAAQTAPPPQANDSAAATAKSKAKRKALAQGGDVRAFRIDGTRANAPEEGGIAGAPIQSWGFEPAPATPAFVPGPISGQNTWLAFTGGAACAATPNTNAPVVSTAGPALSGAQWIDIPIGLCTPGTFNGPFGPTSPPQPAGQYTGSIKIRISNTGGADYDVLFQAPNQAFLTARVKFYYADDDGDTIPGDIFVVHNPGTGLIFQNTGVEYTPGVLHDLRVQVDGVGGSIEYYLDNTLIFTGSLVAGTAIEQVAVASDNFHLPNEKGQVDDIAFEAGFPSTCSADIAGGDNTVDVNDLLAVINAWGNCPAPCPPSCTADIDPDGGNCVVDVNDLLDIINAWGPCP